MNILILGASGGCGQWAARVAQERGHTVTALVRPATEYAAPDGVRVLRGELLEEGVILQALADQEAVVSCVGLKRANPKNPWSRLTSPPDLLSRVSGLLIAAASRRGVQRIAMISAGGVGDSAKRTHWFLRFMFSISKIGLAYRDMNRMEALFTPTPLDWLAVRPVTLTDGGPTNTAHEAERYTLKSTITRGEVARFMVDALGHPKRFHQHTLMIGG